MPASGPDKELRDWIDSGESVTIPDMIGGLRDRCSVGVGGVTVVAGAGIAVCGGVFGNGLASNDLLGGLSSVRSVRIGTGRGGGASGVACARFEDKLLRRLLNKLRPLRLAVDLEEASSFPFAFFFSDEPKASLSRRPGEELRRLLLVSVGTSSVMLDRVSGLERVSTGSLGASSDPVALGPLAADSRSASVASAFPTSTDVVLMRGEEVV